MSKGIKIYKEDGEFVYKCDARDLSKKEMTDIQYCLIEMLSFITNGIKE